MTWAKYGTEFFDQLVDSNLRDDLDDAAQLTHTQALHYLYSVEAMEMTFKKSVLRRFATSTKATEAAQELVRKGLWADLGSLYRVVHHEDVFRQSLVAQMKKRDRDKTSKRIKRGNDPTSPVANDGANDNSNVANSVGATQTDRQTVIQTASIEEVTKQQDFDPNTGEVFEDNNPWSSKPLKTDSGPIEQISVGPDPVAEFFRLARERKAAS